MRPGVWAPIPFALLQRGLRKGHGENVDLQFRYDGQKRKALTAEVTADARQIVFGSFR